MEQEKKMNKSNINEETKRGSPSTNATKFSLRDAAMILKLRKAARRKKKMKEVINEEQQRDRKQVYLSFLEDETGDDKDEEIVVPAASADKQRLGKQQRN